MQHQTSAQTAWFVCDLQHFMISAATAMASVLHTVSHYQCSKCYGKHVAYTISLQTQQLLWQAMRHAALTWVCVACSTAILSRSASSMIWVNMKVPQSFYLLMEVWTSIKVRKSEV